MTLTPDRVLPALRGTYGRTAYLYAPSCASTQRLAPADAPHGTVAVCDHQTAGRGRLGRVWKDEVGASLLVSVTLRPRLLVARWPELSLLTGAAVRDAIEAATGLRPRLEHPNDLVVHDRKLAGILAEALEGRVVVGIGVNVAAAPADEQATSLRAELGHDVDRLDLLVEVLARLEDAVRAWDAVA